MGAIRSTITGPLKEEGYEILVCQAFGDQMTWNLNGLSMILPEDVVNAVKAIPRAQTSAKEDSIRRKVNANGQISVKFSLELVYADAG